MPIIPTSRIQKKLWAQGSKFAHAEAFRLYKFKDGADVTLTVGDKDFVLYPVGELAWTDKAETERAIITAMKAGKAMTVKGVSQRDTETVDTYPLAGFTAALGAIDSACK